MCAHICTHCCPLQDTFITVQLCVTDPVLLTASGDSPLAQLIATKHTSSRKQSCKVQSIITTLEEPPTGIKPWTFSFKADSTT